MSQDKSPYKIEAGVAQHIGNRSEQQDRAAIFPAKSAPGYFLAILADGMSGPSGGHVAAEQVMHTVKQLFEVYNPQRMSVKGMLESIITEAHTMIQLLAISHKLPRHTSVIALIITPQGQAQWAHVGDSRMYRFHGKQAVDRTNDLAYIDFLTRDGKLSRAAAQQHRRSQILMNAVGLADRDPFITYGMQEQLNAGDTFLLCSDGLWHYFTDKELGAATSLKPPRQASEMLIEKAQERANGNGDNCSMIIIKLVALPKDELQYKVEKLDKAV